MLPVGASFLSHAIKTRRYVPAVFSSVDAQRNPLSRPILIRPEHYTFDGGVAVAYLDRRHRVGRFINFVVGKGSHGGASWKRGYKQTQSIAIGHLVGHWPPPRPQRGAAWFDLGNYSTLGLECLDELMAHSRHMKR